MKEALKLAREHIAGNYTVSAEEALAAIDKALAQPEQEPVAHVCVFPLRGDEFFPQTRIEWKNGRPVAGPLYTAPPQRKPKNLMQVKRISDQSIELVFTSCAAASEFENGIKE